MTHVIWLPREVSCWSYGDTWSNEFTTGNDRELGVDDPDQWDAYLAWSEKMQAGEVVGRDEDFVFIKLEPDCKLGDLDLVGYPVDIYENELTSRSES
jgi:hypothetical protein